MAETTEELIDRLAGAATPVRRLRPPLLRALGWLAAVALVAGAAIFAFADFGAVGRHLAEAQVRLEMTGALATGIVAVIAAFYLSLPDRSSWWAAAPLPPFALWMSGTGYNCYRHWITYGPDGWQLGDSADCFRLILGASIPLGVTLLLLLRRANPLAPTRVAALGGFGVAALSACILQFFHPFDVTFLDLSVHLVAIVLVAGLASLSGRAARA